MNEARGFSEQIIDALYPHTALQKKPRTYRQNALKAYLAIVKQRRPSARARRRGIKQQMQYLRRNLGHIERLLEHWPKGTKLPLPRWLLYRCWVIQHVYAQQWEMYQNNSRRFSDRIASIFLVKNLLVLLRIFFALVKKSFTEFLLRYIRGVKVQFTSFTKHYPAAAQFCLSDSAILTY
ncbi:MAG: hypothetical protein U9N50_10730 [Pseudomonadota bacterium]|nr:hypothetical protein [Pseudomonadota bacterium]